jgi:hypothetical protein
MATIKKIKKAQNGLTAAKPDATRVARPRVIDIKKDKKDAEDLKKIKGKYTAIAVPDRESSFKGDSVRYYPGQRSGSGAVPYIRDLGKLRGVTGASDKDFLKVSRSKSARTYQDTTAVKANRKFMGNQKNGGVTKAEGGKWIQKAIKKPGALRKQLGAKPGKPIPAGKLAAAAKKPGKMGQRARLAQTLKKMKK